MTTTTTTETVRRGLGPLRCPCCGSEASIGLDLDDCTTFRCPENDCEFTRGDVEAFLSQWRRVLTWLDLAPAE
jgi:hypothetical protein